MSTINIDKLTVPVTARNKRIYATAGTSSVSVSSGSSGGGGIDLSVLTANSIPKYDGTTLIDSLLVDTGSALTYNGTGISLTTHNHTGVYAPVAQTMYIGTTAVAINRTSAALTLDSITLTTPTISGNLTVNGIVTATGGNSAIWNATSAATASTIAIGTITDVFESKLGNPTVSGYVLSSTTAGVRSWVASGVGTGSVTSVTAGNGLTQSGTATINPTIDVVSAAGTAGTVGTLTITADAVGVSLGTTSITAAAGNHTHSTLYAPISASANYIQNQTASAQTAGLWINGIGKFNGGITANGSGINGGTTSITLVNALASTWQVSSGINNVAETGFSIRRVSDGLIPFNISDSGNTGIGTLVPDTGGKFNVNTISYGTPQIVLGSTGISINMSTQGSLMYRADTGEFRIQQKDGGSTGMTFYTANPATEKMRITPTGKVGIGQINPTAQFEVVSVITGSVNDIVGSFKNLGLATGGSTILKVGNSSGDADIEYNSLWGSTNFRFGTDYGNLNIVNNLIDNTYSTINFVTNGSKKMTISPAGNVTVTGVITATGGNSTTWNATTAALANTYDLATYKSVATLSTAVSTSGTGETLLHKLLIPAGKAVTGSTYKVRLAGVSSSTGTLIFKVKVGANGTTADNQVWISTTSAAQAANAHSYVDVLVTVRSSTTAIADGVATAGAVVLPTLIGAAATAAIVTTANWYIDVTATCSAGTFTAQVCSIEEVK